MEQHRPQFWGEPLLSVPHLLLSVYQIVHLGGGHLELILVLAENKYKLRTAGTTIQNSALPYQKAQKIHHYSSEKWCIIYVCGIGAKRHHKHQKVKAGAIIWSVRVHPI